MCSNFDPVSKPERMRLYFGVDGTASVKPQVWPLYEAPFIRKHPNADVGDEAVPLREALSGQFGLLPHWAGEIAFGRRTYNARSETVSQKPSFRDAWNRAQHCIVPVEAIYEPDWNSGTSVPTRIQRRDGKPMGIAGLWSSNSKAAGHEVLSFTMLTVNADDRALMRTFHKPEDEKRMVVILREDQYDAWLSCDANATVAFMKQFPADQLVATPDPERGRRSISVDATRSEGL